MYFVALASITDPAMVSMAIAESLGIHQTGGRPVLDLLKDYLRETDPSPVLLLLDNFEHILAASSLVVELLDSSAALKVLVTSRAALRVYGEHEFPVPPLPLPDSRQMHSLEALLSNPAVELFSQRAAAVKPDFTITTENAPTVAAICSRVDGLPLAIELAAARVKMLPPSAMLARLESRLQLLTAGPRDVPERQQTLRKTIDWSYDLLSGSEQKLLRRLGVFLGGCTLEAAEAVCSSRDDLAEIFNVMSSLVDKNLVQQTDQGNDEPRLGCSRLFGSIAWSASAPAMRSRQRGALMRPIAWCWRRKETQPSLNPSVTAGSRGAISSMTIFVRLSIGWFKVRMSSGVSGFASRCFSSGKGGNIWLKAGPGWSPFSLWGDPGSLGNGPKCWFTFQRLQRCKAIFQLLRILWKRACRFTRLWAISGVLPCR